MAQFCLHWVKVHGKTTKWDNSYHKRETWGTNRINPDVIPFVHFPLTIIEKVELQ